MTLDKCINLLSFGGHPVSGPPAPGLCEDPVRRCMCWHMGHAPYHKLAWLWLRPKLVTGASHWRDWGGPGHGSAPKAPEHGCGTLCSVILLPDLSGSFLHLLSPCLSQSLSVSLSLFLPTSLVSWDSLRFYIFISLLGTLSWALKGGL